MENVIENCAKALNKATKLKNLNAFITLTHELAVKQAEQSHTRIEKQSKN